MAIDKNTLRLTVFAALAGLAAGTLLLAARLDHKQASAECREAAAGADKLAPFAQGAVAGFTVDPSPQLLPALQFKDADNRERSSTDFRGKVTLLNLWATWCVPCREEMPALDKLQKKLGGRNFSVAPISLDLGNIDKVKVFYREHKILNLPLLHDEAGAAFQNLRAMGLAVGLPTSLLVDRRGCIIGHLAGPADWSSDDAMKLIEMALRQ